MSTDEQKKQKLEEILRLLNDTPPRNSYKSVENFFTRMKEPKQLENIISQSDRPIDIKHLLINEINRSRMPKKIKALFTTKIEKKRIEDLLGSLGDVSLKQSHNSVGASFEQMLVYIDKIIKRVKQKQIKILLDTYREMAPRYYIQFELSLLEKIKKLGDEEVQYLDVAGKLKTDVAMTKELLNKEGKAVRAEHDNLKENFPALMQNALDNLKDEWQRLDTIAVASDSLGKNKDLLRSLGVVVEVAAFDVGIDDERIVVVPGRQFALYFFSYYSNFAVLTVPIYSVESPSEWSIFWHELAGYQVRRLEKDGASTIKGIQDNLLSLKEDNLLAPENISISNKSGAAYIKEVFYSENQTENLELSDLGDFEYQFERVLANLPETDRLSIYDFMKKRGWNVDWFKELFEDAFSVLGFGRDFLDYFADILSRHVAMDSRHPPKEIRMGVAKALLDLAESPLISKDKSVYITIKDHPGFPKLEEDDKKVIAIVAKQITKFMALMNFSNNQKLLTKLKKLTNSISQNDTHQDQFEGGMRLFVLGVAFGQYFSDVMKYIHDSIKQWSNDTLVGGVPTEIDLFKDKNGDVSAFFKMIDQKKVPEAKVNELLNDKDYKKLLNLSFYEADFAFTSIEDVRIGKNGSVIYKSITWQGTTPIGFPGVNTGEIFFKLNEINHHTTKVNWNNWFGSGNSLNSPHPIQ